jgi:hypothetical protein
LLVIGGWATFALTAVTVSGGGSAGVGGSGTGSLIFGIGLGLFGVGLTAIGVAGREPFRGRYLRGAFTLLGVGVLAVTISSLVAAGSAADPLENGPVVILLLGGGLAGAVGAFLMVVSLLRAGGRLRWLGLLSVSGVALLMVSGQLLNNLMVTGPLATLALLLSVAGGLAIAGVGIGVGVLAITGESAAARAAA